MLALCGLVVCSGVTIGGAHAVARHLCRLASKGGATPLYGTTNLEKAEVDHWLEYSITALSQQQGATPTSALKHVDAILGPRVYFVGYEMTLADLAVYGAIRGTKIRAKYNKHCTLAAQQINPLTSILFSTLFKTHYCPYTTCL